MEKRRVVITGVGCVTPLGIDTQTTWQAVKQGKCGIEPITLFDNSQHKAKLAAEVKNWVAEEHIEKRHARHMSRSTQFAVVAAKEAIANSGLNMEDCSAERAGVIVSSGIGGLDVTEAEHSKGLERGFDRVSPFYIPMAICNMAAGMIAIEHGFKGMCTCPVTACAGGTNSIGDAFRHIRDGYAELMLCGGTEAAITPLGIGGFTSMKALHTGDDPTRASIPFDAERNGFVMGEGAAVLLIEELNHAVARGANIIAEIVGYGSTCDAYHMTAPSPDGDGGARAMAQAISDGNAQVTEVDYINAHGTSTPLNDKGETAAVKAVFGGHASKLAISSTKSMTGHMLGAAGAVEAAITALSLQEGFIPPTIGYKVPDEQCDLDIVPNEGRTQNINYALSNSLGFGGHNATLLLKKWQD